MVLGSNPMDDIKVTFNFCMACVGQILLMVRMDFVIYGQQTKEKGKYLFMVWYQGIMV